MNPVENTTFVERVSTQGQILFVVPGAGHEKRLQYATCGTVFGRYKPRSAEHGDVAWAGPGVKEWIPTTTTIGYTEWGTMPQLLVVKLR